MKPLNPIPRFWAGVNRDGPLPDQTVSSYTGLSCCWEWIKARTPRGYGTIRVNGLQTGAHRLSYIIHFGDIPPRLVVCHRCDNPSCVNPEHLFCGTVLTNVRDMDAKGRRDRFAGARGLQARPESRPRGESHKNARLTSQQVLAIRDAWKNKDSSQTELASAHGVSIATISLIVRNKLWQHLTAA